MKKLSYSLPVLLFLALAGVFFYQLKWGKDPRDIPSVLIDKPVPPLDLPGVPGRDDIGLKTKHITGQVSLVSVFGSWCIACVAEHPMLLQIRKTGLVPIHGIDWNEKDPADGGKWLKKNGDPYDRVGLDIGSHAAVDFGVTGAPETFVIDKTGHIRYKHVGPITPEAWTKTLMPMIKELSK